MKPEDLTDRSVVEVAVETKNPAGDGRRHGLYFQKVWPKGFRFYVQAARLSTGQICGWTFRGPKGGDFYVSADAVIQGDTMGVSVRALLANSDVMDDAQAAQTVWFQAGHMYPSDVLDALLERGAIKASDMAAAIEAVKAQQRKR